MINDISVEFNLKVGCKNACKYCPQDRYINAYKGSERELSFESFKKMIQNISLKTTLIFSGMSEPFFNKDFPDMLIYASEKGYDINLFTTLKGFNKDIAYKLIDANVKLKSVSFHMFNGFDFNPKEFAENRSLFRKLYIQHSSTSVISNPISRADLSEEFIGPMKSICHKAFSNIIDINGDIYLCCMDWDLTTKLGNIFTNHLDSSEILDARNEILKKMMLDDSKILCRKCEWFNESKRTM